MKQSKSKLLKIGIGLLTAFIISSCTKPLEDSIIGKWGDKERTNNESNDYFEFFKDNTLVMHGIGGKWTKLSDNQIKVDLSVMGTSRVTILKDISISDDEMKLTVEDKNGAFTGTLKRIK